MFGKSWCGYCSRSIHLLKTLTSQEVVVHDIDLRSDGNEIQNYLYKKTGQRTVPNIFINSTHIGGHSDLVDLNAEGKLVPMLEAAYSSS